MKHLFEAVPQVRTVISIAARYLPFLWLSLHKVKLSRFLLLDNVKSLSPSSAPGLTPARVSVAVALGFPALVLSPSLPLALPFPTTLTNITITLHFF